MEDLQILRDTGREGERGRVEDRRERKGCNKELPKKERQNKENVAKIIGSQQRG